MKHTLSTPSTVLVVAALVFACRSPIGEIAVADLPLIRVGHVDPDHHLALYVAALQGKRFDREHRIWLKEPKPRELYELIEGQQAIGRLRLIKVEGAAFMPTAMSSGEIDVGLCGLSSIAKFADNGRQSR